MPEGLASSPPVPSMVLQRQVLKHVEGVTDEALRQVP